MACVAVAHARRDADSFHVHTPSTLPCTHAHAHVQAGYIRTFHQICVVRCSACTLLRFPRCEEHHTLLTRLTPEGEGMCHRCDSTSARAKGGGACKECGGEEIMEWWMLSEEEVLV